MTDTNRETKILHATACPACGTPIGQPCRVRNGRPMVCAERRRAWQATRDERPVDYLYSPHARGHMLVAPQSAEALAALRTMARDPTLQSEEGDLEPWTWIGGAVRVPHVDMPALTRRLIAAGWRTGEAI